MSEGMRTKTNSNQLPEDAECGEALGVPRQIVEPDRTIQGESRSPLMSTCTPSNHLGHEELYQGARSCLTQFRDHGILNDVEKAIDYATRSLELTPKDHPDLPRRFATLGACFGDRFQRLGKEEDLGKAIECYSDALAWTPHGHPYLPTLLSSLGVAYSERFHLFDHLSDLFQAIECGSRALLITPDGHPDLPSRLAQLGASFTDNFRRLGDVKDLERAIEYDTRALALTPDDHPDFPDRLVDLAVSCGDRFRHLGDVEDLEKAITYERRALALTSDDDPDLSLRLANLGTSYMNRFRCLDDLGDLSRAIEYETRALKFTPDDHPDLPSRLANLGTSYGNRFQRLGSVEDLEKAITYSSRAHSLTPEGHPDLLGSLVSLGGLYQDRFGVFGEMDDLEKSISLCYRAVRSTYDNHPDMPFRLAKLAAPYMDRFRRLGNLEDLEKSLELRSRALSLTPTNHPGESNSRADLGASYSARFHRLGDLEDLEKAIEHIARALALTPDGHPDLPSRHADLGVSYRDRFRSVGDLTDLEEAIEHLSRAFKLTPDDHPELANRHATLGTTYNDRFQRFGKLRDSDKAIEHQLHALTLTPEGHSELSTRHGVLGMAYSDRFKRLLELENLENSIKHYTCALVLTPKDHPDLSMWHAHLGVAYLDRFQRQSESEDLEKAIEHKSRALALTPNDHPDLPGRHFDLALSGFFQYQRTNDLSHFENSLDSFRKACTVGSGTPRDQFRYALHWAELASQHSSLDCIEAYQTAIGLLPGFIWLGATTNQRYQDLSLAENLAINAAFAAISSSQHNLALEWLEHARCVVWNQTLMLRSPLDELKSSHKELATEIQGVANLLHDFGSNSPQPQIISPGSTIGLPKAIGRHRRLLAKGYADLLTEARKLPGFEEFLQPTKPSRLACAARMGPIVVINCHKERCDALVIIPGQDDIRHLPLPNFTAERARNARSDLETSLRRKGLRQRGIKVRLPPGYKDRMISVLLDLWKVIVKPILDFLGFTDEVPTDRLPHITWCPTGALSFLPLHAAGDYDKPRSRVFDYVISSYTPTLTALPISSPSTLTHTPRVLAIGQTKTPGLTPLPGTARELASLKDHTQGKAEYTQLRDDEATTAAVLDAMEENDWVHLACHAHQNVNDPTESGFFLHDGTLELAAINRRSFKNKGLAFLSACQTATGDEKLPDEAIHLASGMLMAGYRSVIATMWSVVDEDAPFVADKIYAELMKDGKIGNGEAGKALHYAIAALRDKVGEKEFGRWVPYIHIGS